MSAQARDETRLETGVARIEQPGREARSAFILGGVRHHADSVTAALFAGTITWARDSVAAAQAIAALAWRPSARSPWQLEGGASGAAFALSRPGSAGNVSAWFRARHALSAHVGALGGITAGNTVRGSTEATSLTGELGAWIVSGRLTAELTGARTRTQDSLLMAASRIFARPRTPWLDMDDVALTVAWDAGIADFSAVQRWRTGIRGTDAAQSALAAGATFQLATGVALVVSAGRQLADPARGAPDATLTTALLRLSFGGQAALEPAPSSDVAVARSAEGATLIVRVRAPVSARVEVAGSFSDWDPVPLVLKDGYWEAQVRVAPGRYRVAYRIDGGEWQAPRGGAVARIREFGGEVGLVVIP